MFEWDVRDALANAPARNMELVHRVSLWSSKAQYALEVASFLSRRTWG